MHSISRILLLALAWLCFALGCIGVFIPVLPTTPLILLASFLFAKASPKCNEWISSTQIYKSYVLPFKESGSIPLSKKLRALAISYAVLLISALLVHKVHVWIILACVAAFLLYLFFVRIPTTPSDKQ